MIDQLAATSESAGAKLPLWLQGLVAVIGAILLVGPAAAVLWYR